MTTPDDLFADTPAHDNNDFLGRTTLAAFRTAANLMGLATYPEGPEDFVHAICSVLIAAACEGYDVVEIQEEASRHLDAWIDE